MFMLRNSQNPVRLRQKLEISKAFGSLHTWRGLTVVYGLPKGVLVKHLLRLCPNEIGEYVQVVEKSSEYAYIRHDTTQCLPNELWLIEPNYAKIIRAVEMATSRDLTPILKGRGRYFDDEGGQRKSEPLHTVHTCYHIHTTQCALELYLILAHQSQAGEYVLYNGIFSLDVPV